MKSDILKCWRDIEIFDIPNFNKNARTLPPHDSLPWLEEQPKLKKNYKYQYTLIFGKIDKKCIFDCINSFIKADSSVDWEGKIHGYSTLAALQLDENGRPEQNSYVRASYTFGMGALQSNVELHTVSKAIEKSRADYVERYHISISIPAGENTLIQGDVVEWRHLYNEIAYLKEVNSWLETEIGIYLLIEEIPVYAESNTTFLNSFYLNDLNELAAFETKELGLALQEYLSLKPLTKGRKDVIKNKNLFFETFNPDLLTLARWPTNPSYGFYSAQTGAVNTIVSNLRNKAGIQGVNGPPGTGKTTLLGYVVKV